MRLQGHKRAGVHPPTVTEDEQTLSIMLMKPEGFHKRRIKLIFNANGQLYGRPAIQDPARAYQPKEKSGNGQCQRVRLEA